MRWDQCRGCLDRLRALHKLNLICDYECVSGGRFGGRIELDTCTECSIRECSPICIGSAGSVSRIREHREVGWLTIRSTQIEAACRSLTDVTDLGCARKATAAVWNLVVNNVTRICNSGFNTGVACRLWNLDPNGIPRYGS